MDGPHNPHDILAVLGEKELHAYLVNEIQQVYRLQGVGINDKHIEVIVRQLMRWVKVEKVGDTEFRGRAERGTGAPASESRQSGCRGPRRFKDRGAGGQVPLPGRERARAAGRLAAGQGPAAAARHHEGVALDRLVHLGRVVPAGAPNVRTLHVGVEETTRVLTEASTSGKVDYLRGLKENVTMGRLIPAGTGFEWYKHVTIPTDEPPPPPPPEELEAQREMDDLTDADYMFRDDGE